MTDRKKILLVHLYSNGDCLYATAIARQIKNDFQGCHLTWAISGSCKNIITLNPFVDAVWEINDVPKDNVAALRKFKKKVLQQKKSGIWDEAFITHNGDSNLAFYDGTIRGMVLRAYPYSVSVPVQPILVLSDEETKRVNLFAERHHLKRYKHVILWEYAPLSGQIKFDNSFIRSLAEKIVDLPSTCVILSSAQSFTSSNEKIIDASQLSVRENAALTHYCTLLIGCSSGITWLCTSSAANLLPMVQLLNLNADFLNPPSVDFSRNGISTLNLIELTRMDPDLIYNCVRKIIEENFQEAKKQYNTAIIPSFKTTGKIVYNLMCYLQFGAVIKHYKVITSVYGRQPRLIKEFLSGIITFPFKLIGNVWRKKIALKHLPAPKPAVFKLFF